MSATGAPPARRKTYYGWWVLGVSLSAAFLGATTSQLFTGAMLPDIQAGTGWSRSAITLGVTLGSFAAGLSSPFFGRLADRHGGRLLVAVGLVVTAAAMRLVALSSVAYILVFYIGASPRTRSAALCRGRWRSTGFGASGGAPSAPSAWPSPSAAPRWCRSPGQSATP